MSRGRESIGQNRIRDLLMRESCFTNLITTFEANFTYFSATDIFRSGGQGHPTNN